MTLINFGATPEDAALIEQIVDRHEALFQRLFPAHPFDRLSASMDLTATHLNGCPLRLKDLLEADDFNFSHDVGGIARHLDLRPRQPDMSMVETERLEPGAGHAA